MESNWIACPFCAHRVDGASEIREAKKQIEQNCPECNHPVRSLKTCRECKKNQFCSHCHSRRKRDVDAVDFRWRNFELVKTSEYDFKEKYVNYKKKFRG